MGRGGGAEGGQGIRGRGRGVEWICLLSEKNSSIAREAPYTGKERRLLGQLTRVA